MPEIQVSRTHRSRARAGARRKAGVVAALSLCGMLAVVGVLASIESPVGDVVLRVPTSPGELPVLPDIRGGADDQEREARRDEPELEPPTSSSDGVVEVGTTGSEVDSGPVVDPPTRDPDVETPIAHGPVDAPVPAPDPEPDPEPGPEPGPPPEPPDEADLVRDLVDEITRGAPVIDPLGEAVLDVLDGLPDTVPGGLTP